MCGIAGIFAYGSQAAPVREEELLAIRDHMATRGPDGAGLWVSGDLRVGLAHRRLAILDLSERGSQPMSLAEGSVWITFNGEIYNYRELRKELESSGTVFKSGTDTEVLLSLYRREGPGFLSKLRGMYAFAIWDAREQRLLLARDPFGIKPLYLADDGGSIRFASQARALIAGGGIDRGLDPAGQVAFYLMGNIPEPLTIYRAVRSLAPGTAMILEGGGRRRTWCFSNVFEPLMFDWPSEGGAGRALRGSLRDEIQAALEESVAAHMIADVPVGCFLSSGIDSSVVCAAASQRLDEGRLRAVTMGFSEYRGTVDDEAPLAAESARLWGVEHRTYAVAREDFERSRDHLLRSMDQPTVDGVNSYFISKAAAEAGLKVALSGVGGDELFGGYPSFRQIPRLVGFLGRGGSLPCLGRALRIASAPLVGRLTSPKWAGVLEYGTRCERAFLLRRSLFMPWELPSILDREILAEGWRALDPLRAMENKTRGIGSDYAKVMALEISFYLQDRLLRDTDWAGMAHSVEIRTPLVDINFFGRIAALLRVAGAPPSKADFAASSPRPLPERILNRPKTGFSIPVQEWVAGMDLNGGKSRGLRGWARRVAREFGF